jgi:hypothetical protein
VFLDIPVRNFTPTPKTLEARRSAPWERRRLRLLVVGMTESRRCPSSPSPQARAQDRQIPWNGAKTGSIPSELAAYNNFQSIV